MDRYVTVIKSATVSAKEPTRGSGSAPGASRVAGSRSGRDDASTSKNNGLRPPPTGLPGPTSRASAAKQTKQLLSSLKSADNPITNNTAHAQFDYVSSCITGHEKQEGKGSKTMSYFESRNLKLAAQEREKGAADGADTRGSELLRGVRVYLGFCDTNTDIEMRRDISRAGGSTTYNQSSATHIVTSQWLSGSKTHKHLAGKSRKKVHVVSPGWIADSIEKGKRQPEWKYTQVESGVQRGVGR